MFIKDDGFKIVKKNNSIDTKDKTSTKSLGTDESNILATKSMQFYIYLGRIDKKESVDSVNSFLNHKLKAVEINGSIKEIKFYNLRELNPDCEEMRYKSFVFSVGYLDIGIVENKALWPLYSVINK